MKTQIIHTESGRSKIFLGEILGNVTRYIPPDNVVIITDENIARYYLEKFPPFPVITIKPGEESKNLETVSFIYRQLMEKNTDRSTFILGIGGGVVCDISGFVASTFLRGLPFGYVSTSLLSQVDASIGGKNGINFLGYKNLVGVIRQPEFVLCDHTMLETLPEREYLSGLAEIIKHAVIRDLPLFERIEQSLQKIRNRDHDLVHELVSASVLIKSEIVQADEKETEVRRLLNYGHTFGHALEKLYPLTHGEAISLGMILANRFAVARELLDPEDSSRISSLLEKLDLVKSITVDREKVLNAVRMDKKRYAGMVYFVRINRIGDAVIEQIPVDKLGDFLTEGEN